jgi:hypothetical protein
VQANCDTTIFHKELNTSYQNTTISDFYPVNEHEYLIIKPQEGLFYKNTLTNEFYLKHANVNDPNSSPSLHYHQSIHKLKDGSYWLNLRGSSDPVGYRLSSDLNSLDFISYDASLFVNYAYSFTTKIVEPVNNRIFWLYQSEPIGLFETSLISNTKYARGVNGNTINSGSYRVKEFTQVENNMILYLMNGGSTNDLTIPKCYIYQYNLLTNLNEKIDSIMINTQKYEQFGGSGGTCSWNYIGNNEIIVTTNNGGTSGIGQISKYNYVTKQIVQLHSFTSLNEQLSYPVNHGTTLIDFQSRGNIVQNPISIIQCIPNTTGVEYSLLKCPDCTYNGVALSVTEVEKNAFSLYPNPTSSTITLQFENQINSDFVTVYSISGQKVLQEKIKADNNQLNVNTSHLQAGIYFVEVGSSRMKFVVE